MERKRRLLPHYLIRAVILGGLAFYIVHLVNGEKLQYYIVPRMIPYVKFGAVGLFLLAVFYLYLSIQLGDKQADDQCECGHEPPRSRFKSGMLYGLFAIPLLLGMALPDKIMGSEVVDVKGMNLNVAAVSLSNLPASPTPVASPSAEEPEPGPDLESDLEPTPVPDVTDTPAEEEPASPVDERDALFPADEYTADFAELGKTMYERDSINVRTVGFLELLTMLDLYKSNFIGKEIVISGFVYREDDMPQDQFVVSRLAMLCCSADSMPYGFLVQADSGATLKKDTWIAMKGRLGTTTYRGNEIIQLKAEQITVIEAPKDPYVYPYIDDFAALAAE